MKPILKTIMIIFVTLFIVGMVGVVIFVAEFANVFKAMQTEKESIFNQNPTVITPTETTAITTETTTIDSTEQTTAYENANRFIGTAGCEFSVNEPFELDGVIYNITRIKISSARDSETPSYNCYKIFYEYTIQNNRKEVIEWDMAYNGNFYGLLCHKEAERNLGGNSFIKDESFDKAKYAPEGTLAAGENISGYNSVVCQPDLLGFPAETWPLYTNEPFSLILHLLINNTDYSLTISFNQNS